MTKFVFFVVSEYILLFSGLDPRISSIKWYPLIDSWPYREDKKRSKDAGGKELHATKRP